MNKIHSFTVYGIPVGYVEYSKGARVSAQVARYWAYLKLVREIAIEEGLTIPLIATEEAPLYIYTEAYFPNRRHSDPENVHKGLKDALFYRKKLPSFFPKPKTKFWADKYTCGTYELPLYDKESPRAIVEIFTVESKLIESKKRTKAKCPNKKLT